MPAANYYSGMPLTRDDALRRDDGALDRLRAAPDSRVLALWRYKHLIADPAAPGPVWHTGDAARRLLAEPETWALLGMAGDIAHFAVDVSHLETPETEPPFAGVGEFLDLRAIGPLLGRTDGAIMAYARGLVYWHKPPPVLRRVRQPGGAGPGRSCAPMHRHVMRRLPTFRGPIRR